MLVYRWINIESLIIESLSRSAHALMLHVVFLSTNQFNYIKKFDVFNAVQWIKDARTREKHWQELIDKQAIVHVDGDTWMVSPHVFYPDGTSYVRLITQWNRVCHESVS